MVRAKNVRPYVGGMAVGALITQLEQALMDSTGAWALIINAFLVAAGVWAFWPQIQRLRGGVDLEPRFENWTAPYVGPDPEAEFALRVGIYNHSDLTISKVLFQISGMQVLNYPPWTRKWGASGGPFPCRTESLNSRDFINPDEEAFFTVMKLQLDVINGEPVYWVALPPSFGSPTASGLLLHEDMIVRLWCNVSWEDHERLNFVVRIKGIRGEDFAVSIHRGQAGKSAV